MSEERKKPDCPENGANRLSFSIMTGLLILVSGTLASTWEAKATAGLTLATQVQKDSTERDAKQDTKIAKMETALEVLVPRVNEIGTDVKTLLMRPSNRPSKYGPQIDQ